MLFSLEHFHIVVAVLVYHLPKEHNMAFGSGIDELVTSSLEPTPGDIRLVGGQTQFEGRVEIFRDGLWSTICDNRWDLDDGQVVCRQLGFGPATSVTTKAEVFGEGRGFVGLESVACVGTETALAACEHGDWYVNDCKHSEDAGVVCSPPEFENGNVRLVNGASYSEGRVEIFYNEAWSSICDNWWDDRDADVVCRELGFNGADMAHLGATFGQGTGPVLFDSVHCAGTEERLDDCVKTGPGLTASVERKCQHTHDVGVTCKVKNGQAFWFRPAVFVGCLAGLFVICIVINIQIKGRKCWTYLPDCICRRMCMRPPQGNYPPDMDEAPSDPGYIQRPGDILDQDSFIIGPPPPPYDIATDERSTGTYQTPFGQVAVISLSGTNSDSGVFHDDESLPSSPPPPYDSVSEYSRYVLSTVHGSPNVSVNTTPSGTPLINRSLNHIHLHARSPRPSPFATPQSSPYASPQIHRASSRVWRDSPRGSPRVSPGATPEIPLSPPPPYSDTDPEELRTISGNDTTMPSVE